ncbi:MAG: TonB-dependent receptor [Acidobacteriia bacterium]|nr:TonB-dependent receptor [Terriglobia bacterium]
MKLLEIEHLEALPAGAPGTRTATIEGIPAAKVNVRRMYVFLALLVVGLVSPHAFGGDVSSAVLNPTVAAAEGAKPAAGTSPSTTPAQTASKTRSQPDGYVIEMRKAIRVFRRETQRLGVFEAGRKGSLPKQRLGDLWHGRVYEYIRNNAFDAVPHEVVQNGGERNVLRRNQFGFSISGPVYVPKLYDGRRSTFFTFSYEGTRQKVGQSRLSTIPTGLQQSGDFSDLVNKAGAPVTIYDPDSTRLNPAFDPSRNVTLANLEHVRDAFPNNRIPLSRLDPVAARMVQELPQPNTNIGPFLRNNYWVNPPAIDRPDGFLSRVDHNLFERHKITVDLAYSKGFQASPRIYETIANPGSPDRFFSERRLTFADTFSISPQSIYTAQARVRSRQRRTAGLDNERNIPDELGLDGVSGTIFPRVSFQDFESMGTPTGSQYRNTWNSYHTDHSLNLRRGRHSWTLSAEFNRYQVNTFMPDAPSGYFQFNDDMTGLPGIINTGDSFASFLLGRSYRAEATDLQQPTYLRRTNIEARVRDEYEVTPNLTATVSLNLDLSSPRTEKFDRQSTVDLAEINPVNGLPGALIFAGQGGEGRAFQPHRARLEPRLGLAWSPTDARNTVIRLSLSQYYSNLSISSGTFGTQGFSAKRTQISTNQQLDPAVVLDQGLVPLAHALPDLRPDAANDTDPDFIPQTARQPRYRWGSLRVERQLPAGLTMRLGGQIYRGKDILLGGSSVGINAIPLDSLAYRDALNDETFRRTLRPFPQFQYFQTNGQFPLGRYKYHSADFGMEKRASHGLTMDFSYSMTRQWDDYSGPGVQDYFNRDNEWSLSRGTYPHRISLSYAYELPFGEGKALVKSSKLKHVVGNWSISGYTRWYSGNPLTLQPEFNNTGGVVRYLRVNTVPGVDPHIANPGPELFFNPLAFADPADFSIGNASRTHPTLRNPGWNNHDLAVTKRLPLSGERSLELLFQGFNFLHQSNWNNPDTVIGPENARNVNAGRIIGSRGGRVVQLGMRFNF